MEQGHPMPPIATNWHLYHDPCVVEWKTTYTLHIQEFKTIIGPEIAIEEIIILDNDSD